MNYLIMAVLAVGSPSTCSAEDNDISEKAAYLTPSLLAVEEVQKELDLTSSQKEMAVVLLAQYSADTQALRKRLGLEFAELRKLSSKERQLQLERTRVALESGRDEIEAKYAKRLESVLMPEQFRRLTELSIQFYLMNAHLRKIPKQLVKRIGATAAQVSQIGKIQRTLSAKYRRLQSKPLKERAGPTRTLIRESRAKVLCVLTTEQRDVLSGLQGREFDLAGALLLQRRNLKKGGNGDGT